MAARPPVPGPAGDRHPQLTLGHRRDEEAVLDGVGQVGVVRAARLEVRPHADDDDGGGRVAGGGRVQGGHKRAALRLVRAAGEELLELVHDQHDASGPVYFVGRPGVGPWLLGGLTR